MRSPDRSDILARFSSFTVAHPEFKGAVEIINESIETTRDRREPSSVLLLGDAGTGKTRICDILTARFGGSRVAHNDGGVSTMQPVISCVVPPRATIKGLVDNILKELGSHRNNHPLSTLESRLFTLLATCDTKIIILDEWQHLISRGAEPTRNAVCDWVKVLINTFKGTVILSGTRKSEMIVDDDEQLAGRFPFRAYLHNFSLRTPEDVNIFATLVAAFSQEISKVMPFDEIPVLCDEKLLLALYIFSTGNLRILRLLLHSALKRALERNDRNFTSEDLAYSATRIHYSRSLTKKNPFELSLSDLQKIIYGAK
ncbi:TniB family NTP-binding protein [Pseudomonas sp. W03]|uniref:TniB family NTP-binding protein n=1 Tax=Pseudomonas sp. W03 TaxID=3090666 RepID=UPI003A4E43C7